MKKEGSARDVEAADRGHHQVQRVGVGALVGCQLHIVRPVDAQHQRRGHAGGEKPAYSDRDVRPSRTPRTRVLDGLRHRTEPVEQHQSDCTSTSNVGISI